VINARRRSAAAHVSKLALRLRALPGIVSDNDAFVMIKDLDAAGRLCLVVTTVQQEQLAAIPEHKAAKRSLVIDVPRYSP
jgi:hypothetical protein